MGMITWLHFADLHCSSSKNYDIAKVLQALWEDLKTLGNNGIIPDFVVFTGDVAQSGKAEEYELAVELFFEPLLTTTHLSKERLFVVPGNHDIEWNKIDRTVARGMLGLLTDRDEVNLFLSPEQDRSLHFRKFESYANFINTYLAGHLFFDTQQYCYQHTLTLDDVNIMLLGLNSTWMSATNCDAQGGVVDQGHLLIGERQLDSVSPKLTQFDLCLALMHHPLNWLHENERTRVKRRLSAKAHFILHGHLHEPEIEIRKAISGQSVFIPTGSLYTHRDFPNAYNLVTFDTQTRQGHIYLRRYVDIGPQGVPAWIKDLSATGDDLDGRFPFELLDTTPQIKAPPAQNTRLAGTNASLELFAPQIKADSLKYAKRVLFVEDDDSWRLLMQSILFPPDFDLRFASSAAEARQQLTNHRAIQPEVDNGAVQSQQQALKNAKRALVILERQVAGYTSLTIPAPLQIQLEDKREEIVHLENNLKLTLQLSDNSNSELLQNQFDLLILNLCLSGDRDYEGEILLNSLCQDRDSCEIPCIVLTGYAYPIRGLFDRYGVFEVFIKGNRDSFDKYRFLRTVRDAVGLK